MTSGDIGRIEGRVAVITGAESEIGLATAQRFSTEGATAVGLDRQKIIDDKTWRGVVGAAPNSRFQDGLDVCDELGAAAAINAVIEEHGRINILVNAAGNRATGPAHELDIELWDRVVDVDLKGCFLVSKHVLRQMVEQRSGSVIHLASIAGSDRVIGRKR